MRDGGPVRLDAVIFGGGVAGLWLLDDLARAGYAVLLLEAGELGQGQTIASQGIIHGGMKYALDGLINPSARALAAMPERWRRALAGEDEPDLSAARLRADFCYLWRTERLRSRLALVGARRGLRTDTLLLTPEARPAVLRECPGAVARLDEQVVDPGSVLEALADQHHDRLLRIDASSGLEITAASGGGVSMVRLLDPQSGAPLDLQPRTVILTAGAGNGQLRLQCGLQEERMQRRGLHMVLARGDLPTVNGHCVDGTRTRVTITTARDYADRTVWQIGGQVAEAGVKMEPAELIAHTRRELEAVLPGIALRGAEWATYRVDRAEPRTRGSRRPSGVHAVLESNVITAWPTKLALAPDLAHRVATQMQTPMQTPDPPGDILKAWPRPAVAPPPWEEDRSWIVADSDAAP